MRTLIASPGSPAAAQRPQYILGAGSRRRLRRRVVVRVIPYAIDLCTINVSCTNIINDKELDIGFKAITFGTYGAFGKSTHLVINKATADAQQIVFSPWVAPGPKQHAYLLFGFSLARANARMLINADSKRRSARNSVRTSRPQSASATTVLG